METLENSERHWPARRKHMFFLVDFYGGSTSVVMLWKFIAKNGTIFRSSDLCGDHRINGSGQGGIRPL